MCSVSRLWAVPSTSIKSVSWLVDEYFEVSKPLEAVAKSGTYLKRNTNYIGRLHPAKISPHSIVLTER